MQLKVGNQRRRSTSFDTAKAEEQHFMMSGLVIQWINVEVKPYMVYLLVVAWSGFRSLLIVVRAVLNGETEESLEEVCE